MRGTLVAVNARWDPRPKAKALGNLSSDMSTAKTEKSRPAHGPLPAQLFTAAARSTNDGKIRIAYERYQAWCRILRLPCADFETWRVTTARLSDF